jgi:uncharacterized protein YggT (Ycf19 family)
MEPVEPMRPVEPVRPVQPVQPVVPVRPVVAVSPAYRAAQIVYFVFGVLEALIIIRLIMKLLGANPDAGFTQLIYGLTFPFVALFQGVFPNPGGSGGVLELSSLLALIVYALLAWGIVRLIYLLAERNRTTLPV